MKVIQTGSVYTYILQEDEWYSQTQDTRTELVVECQAAMNDHGCAYAAILVEPDPIMSISPIGRRHAVWRHAAPKADQLEGDLIKYLEANHWSDASDVATVVLKFFRGRFEL